MNIINKIEKGEFSLWLHPDQIRGYVEGDKILSHLKENNLLEDCATLEDLEEIQKQGVEFYRKHFGNKFVYAWKSVRNRNGDLRVPCLCGLDDRVVLDWDWVDVGWDDDSPALRLASSTENSDPKISVSSDLNPLVLSDEERGVLKRLIKRILE